MKPDARLVIDALKAIIDETEDFNCYLDKIEFLKDENRLLILTQIVTGDSKTSRTNKYALRDNFFKKYLGVTPINLEGEYAFLVSVDELSQCKIIIDKINRLQNPAVRNTKSIPNDEFNRTPHRNLKTLLQTLNPSEELLSKLGQPMHYIRFNSSHEVVPKGRHFITKSIDKSIKDTTNRVLAELDALDRLDNTLFINFTGHEAPVASALYSNGIDCIWQLSIVCDETSQTRIMDQLQDSLPRDELLSRASALHESSLGLILEPNHGFTEIDVEKLPSWNQLSAFGVRQVILLTEKNYNQGNCVYPLDEQYFKCELSFYHWLEVIPQDFILLVIGVGNFDEYSEETCQSIETVFKKEETTSSSTYKLTNFLKLFKNISLFGIDPSPLTSNGKIDKKDEDMDQSTISLD
ncbi:hypothetical protein [Legionella cherrii]|uniref:Uncharacterized protein n=1 Tax=Legionella cherrii TaxID=28084 RepID=A0ABY6T546_9GAMM|nr:hypothetical protein [Legionella cherrii]VEB35714.1 Uncharacterised protein [Legionella cherrii]